MEKLQFKDEGSCCLMNCAWPTYRQPYQSVVRFAVFIWEGNKGMDLTELDVDWVKLALI